MNTRRVLAIGLDGYEETLERQLIESGELPGMARLREKSSRYLLDHGLRHAQWCSIRLT